MLSMNGEMLVRRSRCELIILIDINNVQVIPFRYSYSITALSWIHFVVIHLELGASLSGNGTLASLMALGLGLSGSPALEELADLLGCFAEKGEKSLVDLESRLAGKEKLVGLALEE